MISIDLRWLSTGIGTYSFGFYSHLKQCGPLKIRAITTEANRARVAVYADQVRIVNAGMYGLREQIAVPAAAAGSKLLHVPHYNAPLLFPGTLLVSILDLTHLLDMTFRRSWKSRLYARPMFHALSLRAAHIFTLSEYVKSTIVEHLHVAPERITVVYCGVGAEFHPMVDDESHIAAKAELGTDRPYIMYIGNLKPHKNIPTLLRAYAQLRQSDRIPHALLIVGDDPRGGPELRALAKELCVVDDVIFKTKLNAVSLPAVYSAADVVVQPSFEEGFGLPVIEAMASGTPVICSNRASLPEVGGDAAEYFDAAEPESLANLLRRVVSDTNLRARMRADGVQRARQFTWKDCARRHYEIYQRYLN
jgi:glycosyltransferase involved in cell wall biosynthesis